MLSKSRIKKLEEKMLKPELEITPDLSDLNEEELRRLIKLIDNEKLTEEQAEELKSYYKKITYPDTVEWQIWKDELMEGGFRDVIK